MTTLSYAPANTLPPRYSRLALGSGLLVVSCFVTLALPAILRFLLQQDFVTVAFRLSCSQAAGTIATLLIVPAAAAFATFRHSTAHTALFFWTSLAALHCALSTTISLAAHGISFHAPLSASAILLIVGYTFDQLAYLTLLLCALVFIIRLRLIPVTVLAIFCFAPTFFWSSCDLVVTLLHHFVQVDLLLGRHYYLILIRYFDIPTALFLLFWLALTILVLTLAKSRSATIA